MHQVPSCWTNMFINTQHEPFSLRLPELKFGLVRPCKTDRTRVSATKHQKMVCIVHISTFPISFQHMGASENGVESTLLPFDIGNIMITIDKAWDVWLSNIFRQTPAAAPPGQGLSQPLLVGAQLARGCSLPSTGESNGELDRFSIIFSHE